MDAITPLLDPDDLARLRDALASAGFTSHGIADRIGPAAVAGVRRNDFRALLRATTEPDRLATLIRMFLAGQTEPVGAVAAALSPLPVASAQAIGLVLPDGDGLRAGLDLDVYTGHTGQDFWVLSDQDVDARAEPLRTDHVLGIGNAATTLAGATIRRPVGTALDLGTGCGVQALELSGHTGSVTGTDVSARALAFAATTAALNGQRWELLAGDLLAPVRGRRFDLVVSNPPFVVGPGAMRYHYRDSGRAGDGICAELAAAAPDLLTDGGTMQFLANWLHRRGEDWRERVAGWVAGTGCDAWIIQREVSDPSEYVRLWLRDAAEPVDPARAEAWLDWFDANQIEAVGFGLVTVRAGGHADPMVRAEDLRQQVQPPLGEQIGAWWDRQDWLAAHPGPALLGECYQRAPDLRLTQEAEHDGDDWAVDRQVLALGGGLHWAEEVDPVALALVSGADGTVPMRDQLAVLASAFDTPEPVLAAMAVPVVAHLVERGFLRPTRPTRGWPPAR
ncbi:MAG TPA: methyltransferase [Micromonosporaceae bacterium]